MPLDNRPGGAGDSGSPRARAGRIQILGELHGEVMVFQPMTVREIGSAGAEVDTGFPLQINSLHEFRLTLGDRSIVVKGRVMDCAITDVDQESVTYRSGIEFVELAERVVEVVNAFIDAVVETRRSR